MALQSICTYQQHRYFHSPGHPSEPHLILTAPGVRKENPLTSEMGGGQLQHGSEPFGRKLLLLAQRALITPHMSGSYGSNNCRHGGLTRRDGSRTRSCGSKLFLLMRPETVMEGMSPFISWASAFIKSWLSATDLHFDAIEPCVKMKLHKDNRWGRDGSLHAHFNSLMTLTVWHWARCVRLCMSSIHQYETSTFS